MRRRDFLAAAGAAAPVPGAKTNQPNIVLFISDDHGYWDSPLYGNQEVRTPNLARIAAEGCVYTNTFCGSPACVPSRAILMSGLMPARNGAEANHSTQRPGIRTLPSNLKDLGYRVAHFGKSHFAPKENYADMEMVPSEIRGDGPLNNDLDPAAVASWLERADRTKPVALIVGCHSPHVNWIENTGYDPARVKLPPSFVDTPETRAWCTKYYSDITRMDTQLGVVYDAVRRSLNRNTLFLYTTDNGAQWPFGKWNLYDAGIRLPMAASWPGVIRPGTRNDALISFADFLPTFVELAGGKAPSGIDGQSFARVLTANARKHRDEVFATHSSDGNMNVYPIRCIRTARYKFILNPHPEYEYTTHIDKAPAVESGRAYFMSWEAKARSDPQAAAVLERYHVRPAEELYDTQADPHEIKNLAGRPAVKNIQANLRQRLEQWMRQQGDERRTFGTPRLLSKSSR